MSDGIKRHLASCWSEDFRAKDRPFSSVLLSGFMTTYYFGPCDHTGILPLQVCLSVSRQKLSPTPHPSTVEAETL